MAHELSINNGQAEMMFVGDAPWHKLGKQVPKTITIAEAIKAAGLDWSVVLKPLFTQDEDGLLTDKQAPAMATVRSDNGRILGVVGQQYKVLQNSEAFAFFQPFLDSGAAHLETAGALKHGKRVWVMAKVDGGKADVVGGDSVEQYILLSNSHDGSLAIRVGFTNVRVVCNNTLTAAEGENSGSKLIRIKHTGNPQEALQMVQEAMNLAKAEFETTVEQYKKMAATKINRADMEKFIRVVFNLKSEESAERTSKVLESVLRLAENGRGTNIEGVKGTMWGLYNAATEYVAHERGRSEDSRLDSTWFGTGATINKKAFETAMEMVAEKVAA